MADSIGAGIVGLGRTAGQVATACQVAPELRLLAVAEVDGPKGEAFAEHWGIACYPSHEQLLQRDDIALVFILLPHFLHHPVGMDALAAGKHVFIEKPMAMDAVQCTELIEAARAGGLRIDVGHHYHFTAQTQAARRLLHSGELGIPVMAMDVWHKPFFGELRPPWFLDGNKGGGAWPMNASHMIDRLMWSTGRSVTSVLAQVGSPIFGLSATDSGIAHLRFEDGFSATICHGAFKSGVPRFETEFVCTEAMLRVTASEVSIGRDGEFRPMPLEPVNAQHEQIAACGRALAAGHEMPVPGEYGREVVAVLQATEESARRGCEVQVAKFLPPGGVSLAL